MSPALESCQNCLRSRDFEYLRSHDKKSLNRMKADSHAAFQVYQDLFLTFKELREQCDKYRKGPEKHRILQNILATCCMRPCKRYQMVQILKHQLLQALKGNRNMNLLKKLNSWAWHCLCYRNCWRLTNITQNMPTCTLQNVVTVHVYHSLQTLVSFQMIQWVETFWSGTEEQSQLTFESQRKTDWKWGVHWVHFLAAFKNHNEIRWGGDYLLRFFAYLLNVNCIASLRVYNDG